MTFALQMCVRHLAFASGLRLGPAFGAELGVVPMPADLVDSILRRMIRTGDDYWDSDRATYEDELNAWRDRTATPLAFGHLVTPGLLGPIATRRSRESSAVRGPARTSGTSGRLKRRLERVGSGLEAV